MQKYYSKVFFGFLLCLIIILEITILAKPQEKKPEKMTAPLDRLSIVSGWGVREDPLQTNTGGTEDPVRKFHYGIDFQATNKTPVYATLSGVIQEAQWNVDTGYTIRIYHGDITSGYCHLSQMIVNQDEIVTQGQMIGYSGKSGKKSTGYHLHFFVWDNNQHIYISPTPFLYGRRK